MEVLWCTSVGEERGNIKFRVMGGGGV